MQALRCVALLCLLVAASAVQLNRLDRGVSVHSGDPVSAASEVHIVSDLEAPELHKSESQDVVFSGDEDASDLSALHQKVKRAPSLHHHHAAATAQETAPYPSEEEIQHEVVQRVTKDIPNLLQTVDTNIHKLREKTILGDLVNFLEVEDTSSRTLAILQRMKKQMADLDRRRAQMESARDTIQLEIESKNKAHAVYQPHSFEAEENDVSDSIDVDLKEWKDEAEMKQQQHDVGHVLEDADAMLDKLKGRVQVDYDSLTEF